MRYMNEDFANTVLDAMLFTLQKTMRAYGASEEEVNNPKFSPLFENRVHELFADFCEEEGIYVVLDDDDPPIPDDVDETNYDPYMGCDFYEVDECY